MRNFENEEQLKEAIEIVSMMNAREAYRFLTTRDRAGYYSKRMATAMGLEIRGLTVTATARFVFDKLKEEPDEVIPAEPAPTPDPRIVAKPCDGCGGIGDTPRFLRWAKAQRGEAVTVSVDESGKPPLLNWLTPELIMEHWFTPWQVDTCIKFELLTSGKGDIHCEFKPVDGPGGTRGFAWLPAQSQEFMESGGDLSGDMVIDASDRWVSRDALHETGEHEVGHAIGLPHTNNAADVMYPYSRGATRPHSINDKRAKTLRYPVKQETEGAPA